MTTAAFGMMIAVGDYKGDLKAITDVLNSLHIRRVITTDSGQYMGTAPLGYRLG